MTTCEEPDILYVESPVNLNESTSVSTFLPEEDASICPLLSTTNDHITPLAVLHPLTSCADGSNSSHMDNEDFKVETSSSTTGSSSGIGLDVQDNVTAALFSKHVYQHLQNNNNPVQDGNGYVPNSNITLSKNTPSFVSWNWPLIRKCTFCAFMSALLAMCAVVIGLIVTIPKTCNPRSSWYQGGVFYEIFPANFQDSDNDGIGDLRGISSRVDYLVSMGVNAVHLNSIFPSPHYPDDYENVSSLMKVATVLGELSDILELSESLHSRNISLILDIPIYPYLKKLRTPNINTTNGVTFGNDESLTNYPGKLMPNTTKTVGGKSISDAICKWVELGVDGFYIRGLEQFAADDIDLISSLKEWKRLIGANRVIIISESTINVVRDENIFEILQHIDMVDVNLNVFNGTQYMEERIRAVLDGVLAPSEERAWIHWSIGGFITERKTHPIGSANITLAATILQLMLPGTTSIFYGDEIVLESGFDPSIEHNQTKHIHHLTMMWWPNTTLEFANRKTLPWVPKTASPTFENFAIISNMIALRSRSPSIYKNAICKLETKLSNTQIHRSHNDILIVERIYPRRNSFVSISNFGNKHVTMDMTSMYYSGYQMLGKNINNKIYFAHFEIDPLETIVVKLDK